MRLFLFGLLVAGLATPSLASSPPPLPPVSVVPKLGDTLECRSLDGIQAVFIVVGRIDEIKTTTIVSVSLFDNAGGPPIAHLPFDAEALADSCEPAAKRDLSPDFERGYAAWREAFDAGKAGAFTKPPAEVYGILLTQIPAKP